MVDPLPELLVLAELPLELVEPLLELVDPLLEVLEPLLEPFTSVLEPIAAALCAPESLPPQPLSVVKVKANIDVVSSHTQKPLPLVSTSIIVYFDSFTGGGLNGRGLNGQGKF